MRRRQFIGLLAGAAIIPSLAVRAQQPEAPLRRIGVLDTGADSTETKARYAAFLQSLQKLGWTVGGNLQLHVRSSGGTDLKGAQAAAAEVIAFNPDVILSVASLNTEALSQATKIVPIVFVNVSDPLGSGLVKSLARPGGNVTGFSNFEFSIAGKWLETLKEVAPGIKRVLVLHLPTNIGNQGLLRSLNAAGAALGVKPVPAPALNGVMVEQAIESFAQEPNGGLVALPGAQVVSNRDRIVASARRNRLPAIYPYRTFSANGGLMAYGTNMIELYEQASRYVDRILRGEKPADLPVQAPINFEFVINLRAARELGLSVPLPLLARADEVIE